jgi:hypothetical protein
MNEGKRNLDYMYKIYYYATLNNILAITRKFEIFSKPEYKIYCAVYKNRKRVLNLHSNLPFNYNQLV